MTKQQWPIELTFEGEPIASSRPRVTRFGAYMQKEYVEYKQALSGTVQCKYPHLCNTFPPSSVPNERRKYFKQNRFSVRLNVFRSKNRGDVDNFLKTVQDALQSSGIMADDSQIDEAIVEKFIDKENPRITLKLWKIPKNKVE